MSASIEKPKLYAIPGSHACRAAILMLEHKGIDYETANLRTGFQPPVLKLRGFLGGTVPALAIGERRVQTNHDIARVLEGLYPDPPLFPKDAERRKAVEAVERFADEILQTTARRLVLAAGAREIDALVDGGGSGRLGPILHPKKRARSRIMSIATRMPRFGLSPETEALDLAAVPRLLDLIEVWIENGVVGGDQPNAADFQIAPSICLLAYRKDLCEEVEASRAWSIAERVMPAPDSSSAREPVAA